MERENDLSRKRDSKPKGNWKTLRLLRTVLAMVLTAATILGAVAGGEVMSGLCLQSSWRAAAGESFSESQSFQQLTDGYLQLLELYMDMETVLGENLQGKQKGEENKADDILFLKDTEGNTLTLKQVSELGGHGYDYRHYIQNYLNSFQKNSEEGISLKNLTEGICFVNSMVFVKDGTLYYREGYDDGLTGKQRRAAEAQAKQLPEALLYSGNETVLPSFEANEYSGTEQAKVTLQTTEQEVVLSSSYQKWLFDKFPEYAQWNMVCEMAEACRKNFKGQTADGTDRSLYRKAVLKDYRKTHDMQIYVEDFQSFEITTRDGEEYCRVLRGDSGEEVSYRMDQKVYINNGKTAVTVRDLYENPYRFYEQLNLKDLGKVYDTSLSEYADKLLQKGEANREKAAEETMPWNFTVAPCSMDMAADLAQFYLAFYEELDSFLDASPFLYMVKNQDTQQASSSDVWNKLLSGIEAGNTEELLKDKTLLFAYYDNNGSLYYSNLFWEGFANSGDLQEYLQQLVMENDLVSCGVGFDMSVIRTAGQEDPLGTAYQLYQADQKKSQSQLTELKKNVILLGGCMLIMLLCFLVLAVMTGHRSGREEIVLFRIDHIWVEVFLGLGAACAVIFCSGVYGLYQDRVWYEQQGTGYVQVGEYAFSPDIVLFALVLAAMPLCLCGILLSLIRQGKAGVLFRSSALRSLFGRLRKLLGKGTRELRGFEKKYCRLKTFTRYCVAAGLYVLFWGILGIMWVTGAGNYLDGEVILFGCLLGIALFGLSAAMLLRGLRNALADQNIREGAKRIADGELSYQIAAPGKISREQQELIDVINHIGEGLERAVDESVRSERMKAELITNVSHDIKTPLTSVINYVDLLKREKLDNERAQEYLEILDQKSQRLKVLIEDLVEASKASSGAMELQITGLNFNELVHQTNGEFEEKFAAAGLTLVAEQQQEEIIFRGDGRRVYRVLENLYGNVAKYAMAGTRVYVELSRKKDTETDREYAEFSIKNISREALNITPEELTERFVRGEKSRTTEGSGLGLSIAKNLTELMGGSFRIYLDGDLFRVTITFPM